MEKLKNILSKLLMIVGIASIIIAGILFIKNENLEKHAKEYSNTLLQEMNEQIYNENPSEEAEEKKEEEKEEQITIDENLYIGILNIPKININLPIQKICSYENLYDTPCMYNDEPFSIAAHNYDAHFGQLPKLIIGDEVYFLDIDGIKHTYKVVETVKIDESETEFLEDNNYDLSLFTCSVSNNSKRLVIRLQLID